LVVTGILTAAAATTLILQTALILASKCCVYVYEPSLSTLVYLKLTSLSTLVSTLVYLKLTSLSTLVSTLVYLKLTVRFYGSQKITLHSSYYTLQDFLASFVLVVAATGSTTLEGVVAYHWSNINQDSRDDSLFRAVAGSTVSYSNKIHFLIPKFSSLFPCCRHLPLCCA
jgi:hypothetical protein